MLSPSPLKRSKARPDMADDAAIDARKRCKNRSSTPGCGVSPRISRRSRKQVGQDEIAAAGEEILGKPRKKRVSDKSKKNKSITVASRSMYQF